RVALKVLPPGALGDARHVERFQREAKAAARLHHSNIVPVFGVGGEAGTHYYVMQYIEGRPLDEVLAELRRLRAEADRPRVPPAGPGTPDARGPARPHPPAGPPPRREPGPTPLAGAVSSRAAAGGRRGGRPRRTASSRAGRRRAHSFLPGLAPAGGGRPFL